MSEFGANEWLVDEMYEKYQQDPNSVDKVWWDFFRNNGAPGGGNGQQSTAPKQQPKEQPKPEQQQRRPAQQTATAGPDRPAAAQPAPAPSAASRQQPAVEKQEAPKGQTVRRANPVPKEPEKKAPVEASDEPTYTVLRGAPARTVQNMDASLTVPTATSVRSVPVKLLWDNRIVINNHLARARGGKVSFTHIIGYALVQALKSIPDMNVAFDVVDGKPNLVQPAHINLGLAIDMPKPDGTRQLLVPSIKAAETMDFAQFWTAYEDIVRRARANKLELKDFQGTTISLTDPGTIGTNHSVPRLM
jgi:2-oxoglutarate dehydrogenase E1 component